MSIFEILSSIETLIILGIGILFLVLILQFVLLRKVGKIFKVLGLDNDPTAFNPQTAPAGTMQVFPGYGAPNQSNMANNARVTAAITAAITEYRKAN